MGQQLNIEIWDNKRVVAPHRESERAQENIVGREITFGGSSPLGEVITNKDSGSHKKIIHKCDNETIDNKIDAGELDFKPDMSINEVVVGSPRVVNDEKVVEIMKNMNVLKGQQRHLHTGLKTSRYHSIVQKNRNFLKEYWILRNFLLPFNRIRIWF